MKTIKTRWVLTDELEIYPTTISGKELARMNQDENEILKEVLRPIIGEHYSKWQAEGMGSIYHAKEYLNNELHMY